MERFIKEELLIKASAQDWVNPKEMLPWGAQDGQNFIVLYKSKDFCEAEIFEEIISMLHCFAMKMYSKRRKRKLEIVQEDLKNEISL